MEPSLSLITRDLKRRNVLNILENPHPRHNERLWMAGFMFFVGYSPEQVCQIIKDNCNWQDYNESYTEYQVNSVFSGKGRSAGHSVKSLHPPQRIEDIILDFLKNTEPINFMVPVNVLDAVVCYYSEGFIPIPKSANGKYPAFDWKRFQTHIPTTEELISWDWSNGICLLANDKYSFLDIDKPGYEFLFNGRHVEKTPRGGLHVFGKGKMQSVNIPGAEIKGKGTLVVAAPTPGYEVIFK